MISFFLIEERSVGDWYCARISLVKGNAGGLKPLEGT